MSTTENTFTTKYSHLKGMDYIFLSLDRLLTGEECEELAMKYFEEHKSRTLPGQALIVDIRPAFRNPSADVTPQVRVAAES
jgi:hypothetical protein